MAGAYLAFTIPISVFPNTDFPRVVIGVDNGVMPIDQMMVTITRPIEEVGQQRAWAAAGALDHQSRLGGNRPVLRLARGHGYHAPAGRCRAIPHSRDSCPQPPIIQTHRLNFASFPIIGYSLTSDTVPQTQLWTMANYDLKPRLNRLDGVATVVVQGGQEPEFPITPDPAKLLAANVTVSDMLDAVRRTNLIDSPGLLARKTTSSTLHSSMAR